MITYEEGKKIIDRHADPLKPERIYIGAANGRFLAEDLVAHYDSPPFPNSAVDGFGRRLEDLDAERLRLVGKLKAGDKGTIQVHRGEAVRIFTGAPIPSGIRAVTMQEDCEVEGDYVRFHEATKAGKHLRSQGEDFKKGETVLRKGEYLGPAAIGIAISAGFKEVSVVTEPKISLLTTGSELIDINHELPPWKIYDSNFHSLSAAVNELTENWTIRTASDKPDVVRKRMSDAMLGDVVITSGGVSVGEFDLMKDEFAFWKVKERFWCVAIKPGKPIYFGTRGKQLVFGLPGNPVSALVTYFLFVRPAVLKLMGHPHPWPEPMPARFEGTARKDVGRLEFLRGTLDQEGTAKRVQLLEGQGSHQLAALAASNCLIHFPLEASELNPGEEVEVTPLTWGLA